MADEDDLLFKQWYSVIDARTTICCLFAAGQIRRAEEEFETINGNVQSPPAHWGCRAKAIPWMPGFINALRPKANKELQQRPIEQRRRGPEGELGVKPQQIPPKLVMPSFPVPDIPAVLLKPKPGVPVIVPPGLPPLPGTADADGDV